MQEPIRIDLVRDAGVTKVYVARRPVAVIERLDAHEEISLPGLSSRVRDLSTRLPDARCVIDPDPGVPHGHVVAVLDTLLAEDLVDITFAVPRTRRR